LVQQPYGGIPSLHFSIIPHLSPNSKPYLPYSSLYSTDVFGKIQQSKPNSLDQHFSAGKSSYSVTPHKSPRTSAYNFP